MTCWMNLGQNLKVNAKKFSTTVALKDKNRRFTYPQTNDRVNRLANSLLSLGLAKGDRVAVLMENSIEIIEIYLATAKSGLVIVPINFRLVGPEISYIVNNSDAKAFIVHDEFAPEVDRVKTELTNIAAADYFVVGKNLAGYRDYEELISGGSAAEPDVKVEPQDTWVLIYTSGTTGKPKGVIRSHESHVAFYLINAVDFGFNEHDFCMNVMPLCHINSTFFTFTFLYIGASVYIHPAQSFKPEEILDIVEKEKITFISLIPTHYNLILNAPEEALKKDVSSIKKLLCSSAPVRKSMKECIMGYFKGVELYEGYGSTEAGLVTLLKPEDQLRKIGSIGRPCLGVDLIKLLDENDREVGVGEVGELYSRGPMMFDEYNKKPEKTKASFRGDFFSAGDLVTRDKEGYYYIVDRKDNMIITGGEHVYPSEVEEVVSQHPKVRDVAVVGLPDDKWGEAVMAAVVLRDGENATSEEIVEWCRSKMAGFKKPKKVIFINYSEMPRSATGKTLHRKLRDRFAEPV